MKVWSGSAWAEKPAKVWSGSAWVVKPVKVWSGSAWVTKPAGGGATAPTTTIVSAFTPGAARADFDGEVGYLFRPGTDMTVSWMGRYVMPTNWGPTTVNLYRWSDQTLLRAVSIDLAGKTAGTWAWVSVAPVPLTGGVDYVLLEAVAYGVGQTWSDNVPTTVPSCSNINSIYRIGAGAFNPVTPGYQYVGLDLGWN